MRIPTRQLNAVFGRVAGVNAFDHDAFAIAGLVSSGFGNVLPFGMPVSAGGGDGYACIKSGSGGTSVEPCGGASSGNFGYVDFGQFGNADVGTTAQTAATAASDRARRTTWPSASITT